MHFRTEYKKQGIFPDLNHSKRILFTGSCFSENISSILKSLKFQVLSNPFGTLYHPIPIFNSLILNHEEFIEDNFDSNGVTYNWNCHSYIRGKSENEIIDLLKTQIGFRDQFIKESSHLFLTFGSAKLYSRKSNNKSVANCHKIPQREFNEKYSKSEDIISAFESFYKGIKLLNNQLKIVLSISPVRYLGDGLEMNQYNKSILIQACHYLSQQFEGVFYFPAYEIFMDDLRDYRFYEKDLIHPNESGIEYIYKIFESEFMDSNTTAFLKKIESFNKGIKHKAFNPDTPEHQKFLKDLIAKGEELSDKGIDVSEDLEQIRKQL